MSAMTRWAVLFAAVTLLVGCPDDAGSPGKKGQDIQILDDSAEPKGDQGFVADDGKPAEQCKKDSDCEDAFTGLTVCQKPICDKAQKICTIEALDDGTACDDGDPCTQADQCKDSNCAGTAKVCDDKNPCTDDDCVGGDCKFTDNTAKCDDGNKCTTGDQCKDGTCTGDQDPACKCDTDADCAPADDADLCNGVLVCEDHKCVTDEKTVVTCDPSLAGPCETVQCDKADGKCKAKPKDDGASCDDGNACTKEDKCSGGKCKGAPLVCDDENVCTTDSCNVESGCKFENNDKPCDDGDLCTVGDKCTGGGCKGTENPDCKCTADGDCSGFEDGDLCNGTLVCKGGACVVDESTVKDCSEVIAAAGKCKTVKCEPTTGDCVTKDALNGTACDDGNACTFEDHCESSNCVGLPKVCDDKNPCTDDSCVPAQGCKNTANTAACEDGNACTKNDKCAEGACVGESDPACQCTANADCAAMEDGNLCNGTLVCKGGKCAVDPSTVVACDPAESPCKKVTCVPETGKCVKETLADGTACDDGNACTNKDHCAAGACKGTAKKCDDGNLCTDDACDAEKGCVYTFNDATCNDGNSCTQNDVCKAGTCSGTPVADCKCTDNDDCGMYDDGNKCNGVPICVSGKCVVDPTTVVACPPTADPECAVNFCEVATGKCVPLPYTDGKPCNDEDACTVTDKCKSGVCVGTGAPVCDDGNPCTDDGCKPAFGCTYVPNELACDDGNACTKGDKCKGGLCQAGEHDFDLCPESCTSAWTLKCGSFDSWSTGKSGATDVVTMYGCNLDEDYEGPEYAYLFKAPYDGKVTVTLSNDTFYTDVLILEQSSLGCDPKACLDWGYSSATADMSKDGTYYFLVDSVMAEADDYTIEVLCVPAHEQNCTDGEDEDEDGATDCGDPDCAADPTCQPPQCDPFWPLGCGETDSWKNYGYGSTNAVDEYACSPDGYPAPEYSYVLTSPVNGKITVTLSDQTAETDILVLESPDGTCHGEHCIAFAYDTVEFEAKAGTTYFLVVDGYNGAEGTYKIEVECPPDTEIDCEDGKDDDGDEKIDCEDDDCKALPLCAEDCNPIIPLELSCGDVWYGANDDPIHHKDVLQAYNCTAALLNGPEVSGTFVAPYDGKLTVTLSEESADTRVLVMSEVDGGCIPDACMAAGDSKVTVDVKAGNTYYVVVEGYNGAEGDFVMELGCVPASEQNCKDGLDDDGDGAVDCADADCFGVSSACQPACVPSTDGPASLSCPSDKDDWTNEYGDNVVTRYGCNPYTYSAPEYVYTFVAEASGKVTVTMTGEGEEDDLVDVLVLEDTGLGCNPGSCIGWSFDEVTFDAVKGTTYYIVVDGLGDAFTAYDLTFTCGG